MAGAPRKPDVPETPDSARPSANKAQPDEPRELARGDPDSVARKHVDDVLKSEDDPVSNEPSQSSNVNQPRVNRGATHGRPQCLVEDSAEAHSLRSSELYDNAPNEDDRDYLEPQDDDAVSLRIAREVAKKTLDEEDQTVAKAVKDLTN